MQRDPSHLHRRVGRRVLLAAIGAAILTVVVMTATATARSTAAAPANVNLTPTANMPLRNAALLTFLRARKDGDDMLGGSSTRRLVQVSIG